MAAARRLRWCPSWCQFGQLGQPGRDGRVILVLSYTTGYRSANRSQSSSRTMTLKLAARCTIRPRHPRDSFRDIVSQTAIMNKIFFLTIGQEL